MAIKNSLAKTALAGLAALVVGACTTTTPKSLTNFERDELSSRRNPFTIRAYVGRDGDKKLVPVTKSNPKPTYAEALKSVQDPIFVEDSGYDRTAELVTKRNTYICDSSNGNPLCGMDSKDFRLWEKQTWYNNGKRTIGESYVPITGRTVRQVFYHDGKGEASVSRIDGEESLMVNLFSEKNSELKGICIYSIVKGKTDLDYVERCREAERKAEGKERI